MTTLLQAVPADAPALSVLMEETFRAAYGHVASEDKLRTHVEQHYDASKVAQRLRGGEIEIWFVPGAWATAAAAIGYVQIGLTATPPPEAGKALEVQRCYLRPEAIGSGAGTLLIEKAKVLAQARDAGLYLSVYQHAPRAVRFYEKHAFRRAAAIKYYIADVEFDDWLMVWP